VECTICGKKTDKLFKIDVEGSVQEVCEACTKYGEKIPEIQTFERAIISKNKPIRVEDLFLVENYGKLIREKRKRMGLDRKKFANKIKEKESVIRRVESEEMQPNEALLKKIERFLNINLMEKYENKKYTSKKSGGNLTIGDVLEVD